MVQGVLELATKYEVESLRSHLTQFIESDWPKSLSEWDSFQVEIKLASQQHSAEPNRTIEGLYLNDRFPEPASALHFAKKNGRPIIVRAVMYLLATAERELDRDTLDPPPLDLSAVYPFVRWRLLDSTDWSRLVQGREKLLAKLVDISSNNTLVMERPVCDRCIKGLKKMKPNLVSRLSPKDYHRPDPLRFLYNLVSPENRPANICDPCWSKAKVAVAKMRKEIWDQLPDLFGWADEDFEV